MMKRTLLICCLVVCSAANSFSQHKDFPKLTGPYLGQKPPGDKPEIFAPGIVSLEASFECCRAVTPYAEEFFFVRGSESGERIFRMIEEAGGWTKPEPVTYTNKAFQYTPFISPTGDKLLFMTGDSNPKKDRTSVPPEIWILTRDGKNWGAPRLLGSSIGGVQPFYITMAKNGNLYFSCVDKEGIYKSEFKNGDYRTAEKLPEEINYPVRISHPYISPDEDFIIFDARNNPGELYADLFISFHNKDGSWTRAVNMGDKINSAGHEVCPSVSPDGKYIFFGRAIQGKKTDIYWVSSRIIEDLRPKDLK